MGAIRLLHYLWAGPVTLPAGTVALLARVAGGRWSVCDGVVEVSGGFLPRVLSRMYPPMPIAAITLGHVVLAQSQQELDRTRTHERVHVRQYERWGPFFPLLYLGAALGAWLTGGDPYRDNRFEREAFQDVRRRT